MMVEEAQGLLSRSKNFTNKKTTSQKGRIRCSRKAFKVETAERLYVYRTTRE
jgi:hypothetical protein